MTQAPPFTGGCYCGALRYEAHGAPTLKAQCYCRACQHVAGGGPNFFMLMPTDGFRYTAGTPTTFKRPDIENAVTREFCATCGTHIATRRPGLDAVVLKIGTLDDPARFKGPKIAIYVEDAQPFHQFAEDLPRFDKLPD